MIFHLYHTCCIHAHYWLLPCYIHYRHGVFITGMVYITGMVFTLQEWCTNNMHGVYITCICRMHASYACYKNNSYWAITKFAAYIRIITMRHAQSLQPCCLHSHYYHIMLHTQSLLSCCIHGHYYHTACMVFTIVLHTWSLLSCCIHGHYYHAAYIVTIIMLQTL